jgi:hypothetical protein
MVDNRRMKVGRSGAGKGSKPNFPGNWPVFAGSGRYTPSLSAGMAAS